MPSSGKANDGNFCSSNVPQRKKASIKLLQILNVIFDISGHHLSLVSLYQIVWASGFEIMELG